MIVNALKDFEPTWPRRPKASPARGCDRRLAASMLGPGRTRRTCGRASTRRPGTNTNTLRPSPGTFDTSPIRFPERPRRQGISSTPLDHHLTSRTPSRTRDMSGAASPHRSRSQPTASCSNGIRSSTRWLTSTDMSSSEQSPTSRRGAACTPTTAAHFEPIRPPSVRFAHFTSSS